MVNPAIIVIMFIVIFILWMALTEVPEIGDFVQSLWEDLDMALHRK